MSLTRNELEELSSISIADSIPQAQVDQALQSAPFVNRGVLLNHRDLGLVPGSKIRANTIYRSGGLQTTPEITGWLSDNVTKVFDLRSDPEVNKSPDPQSPSFVNIYYPQGAIGSHLNVKDFTGDGSVAWGRMYITVLQLYVPSLRAILEHVRDSCTPFLFHCAAGRDRTGVVAGMLHHIAGTPEDDIVYDYMLSRIGLEPARDMLMMGIKAGLKLDDVESPEFHNVASIRPSFWAAFQKELGQKHGGWDGYIRETLGFSDADVERMRDNLNGE